MGAAAGRSGRARRLLGLATVAVWAITLWGWFRLPPEIPMHFGLSGRPDRWAERSIAAWCLLPAMATVFAVAFGWLLPGWFAGLARSNSKLLNMPDAERFRALPEDARVRAVGGLGAGLAGIALAVDATIGWVMFATVRVANGEWQLLPMLPTLAFVLAIVGASVWMAVAGQRAVRREVDRVA
ncbi:MAG TPA: DUF1648 domain-containing protein [bacterium]|nr:DUF1648 domain-containing protein [bacterium]